MNTMDEKAFFTEQLADSPASLKKDPFFFRFIIRRESGISTLVAFRSTLAGQSGLLESQGGSIEGLEEETE